MCENEEVSYKKKWVLNKRYSSKKYVLYVVTFICTYKILYVSLYENPYKQIKGMGRLNKIKDECFTEHTVRKKSDK